MNIFIELGNTSLKLATSLKDRYQYIGTLKYGSDVEDTLSNILELDLDVVDNVYVCSVAKPELNARVTQYIQTSFQVYPTFLTTQPESCGIVCGYEQFDTLGVDRWMAIIGSCAHSNQPTIIVDAGTALTVDMVIDKKHYGGFIVPGLGLMKGSLFKNTAIPEMKNENLESVAQMGLLAKDTESAISGGTLFMVSAFLNSLIENLESETGRRFKCIGTGGDFETILPMLDKPFEVINDLTLLGMVEMIESC
ncbi:type III pantothenate kinase [Hydrogenovibrio sp. SC-1]|uniref:type III pantothenate kinase n=1 Tax=Hydrogenovibrio sp. SC-1 TaxID=2065820 RepID=UPI000C7DFEDD|nr:type III pantothenate kinase [Hydrogenovibrio sp. SC-1]PLA74222.1 type III pantothenate kinase [Hydrogenovibrio sp. SC-1]